MSKDDIKKWLSTRKGGTLPVSTKKLKSVGKGENPIGITHFPPLTCDARFSLGKFQSIPKGKFQGIPLPQNWNNFTGDERKYKLSTRPMNQGNCGSCFACSTATSMNDAFVFQGLAINPNISPLSILSCQTGNDKCGGGNPSVVLDQAEENGVASSNCVDYNSFLSSFCNTYPDSCNENGLNAFVPPCGCCKPQDSHYKYFTKNKILAIANSQEENDSLVKSDANQVIKEHLFTYGAAVTGFNVPRNWMYDKSENGPGTFEITKGVYVETENYGDVTDIPTKNLYSQQSTESLGGHAVSVVGWGVEKDVHIPSANVVMDLPYWYVRNSWGPSWGLSGYYKIAMYQPAVDGKPEINNLTAIERHHENQWGGILLFEPYKIEPFTDEAMVNNCPMHDYIPDSDKNKNFKLGSQTNNSVNGDGNGDDGETKNDNKGMYYFILSIVMSVILVLLIYFLLKK